MSFSSRFLRVVVSVILLTAMASFAFADTIRLKDGSIIKGQIVSFGSGIFVVEIGEGSRRRQMTFKAAEVESINFDSPGGPPQLTNSTNRTASYTEPSAKPAVPPKVIVSGTTSRTNEPQPTQAKQSGSAAKMPPIEWKVSVFADNTANGWTNTGWVVKKGQRIRVVGDGKVSLGKGQNSPPSGISSLNDDMKLLKNVPTGALIAVIGDDNNDFIYVGAEREFTATRDGALFLGINEGYLEDNSGAFSVKIEILPDEAG